jgi:phospholipid/cholesterol/gamma-HCH transport system substrate-binding protein
MTPRGIPGQRGTPRVSNVAIGVVAAVVIAIGSYLAYTKELPFGSKNEVQAVFANAQSVRGGEPVRIAGVDIGEVTSVSVLPVDGEASQLAAQTEGVPEDELPADAAMVTIALDDDAPALREDAQLKLRPRLFLEGNYFVDVSPGTPGGEAVPEGHTFPLNQTSSSVNLDSIFTTLQGGVRNDLQTLLEEFGGALTDHGGADGFNELNRTAPKAYRYTAEFNEAFLGTEEGDLSGTLRGFNRVFRGLARNEQTLQDFVVNLRVVAGSFAAEDEALGNAIEQLPGTLESAEPAYANLNAAFPSLRAFAREALPGVRSSPSSLRAATPFVEQLSELVARDELRGLLAELRPTVPNLALLAQRNLPFLEQSRALSSCFNEVIIPWSHDTTEPVDPNGLYPHDDGSRVFESTAYGLSGINGEHRSGDGNGHYVRTLSGSGANLVRVPPGDGLRDDVFALTPFPILGAMPRIGDSAQTRFRPEEPCEEQEPPNLEAGIAAPAPQEPVPTSWQGLDALSGPGADKLRAHVESINAVVQVEALRATGDDEAADEIVRQAQRAMLALGMGAGEVAALGEEYK